MISYFEFVLSQDPKSNPHPSDEDLSLGTPNSGAPSLVAGVKNGWFGLVLSHPWRKNKGAPRMGHGGFKLQVQQV
jgi:hypothetical protein